MSRFVSTDDGCFVNLDLVASISHTKNRYKFHDASGNAIATVTHLDPEFYQNITAPVIPATPGAFAYVLRPISEEEQRTHKPCRPDTVLIRKEHVIGWRVGREYREPVLSSTWGNFTAEHIWLTAPDGRVYSLDRSYDDLDEAKNWVLEDAQAEWDEQEARAAKKKLAAVAD